MKERIDHNYGIHHARTGQDFGDRKPSEVFNDTVLTCFIDDAFGLASRQFLNMGHVMWEYDPFTALGGNENCTVHALRAQSAGHDVSIRSTRRADAPTERKILARQLAVAGN